MCCGKPVRQPELHSSQYPVSGRAFSIQSDCNLRQLGRSVSKGVQKDEAMGEDDAVIPKTRLFPDGCQYAEHPYQNEHQILFKVKTEGIAR